MASFCDARKNQGLWFLRIDDIDPPREVAGAADAIATMLEALGFEWDGDIQFQSQHTDQYLEAINALSDAERLYNCSCSRRELSTFEHYPGTCLPSSLQTAQQDVKKRLQQDAASCLRLNLDIEVNFVDQIAGKITIDYANTPNDPVIFRKDSLFAYALACAVDDMHTVNHVVRGSDLLATTAHQIAIMQVLEMPAPNYAHIPVVTNSRGQKLSKQTHAAALDSANAIALLSEAWQFLGQQPLEFASTSEFWDAAIANWCLDHVDKATGH